MNDPPAPPSTPPAIVAPTRSRAPTFDTLDDAAEFYARLRDDILDELRHQREMQKHTHETLDLILARLKLEDDKAEVVGV